MLGECRPDERWCEIASSATSARSLRSRRAQLASKIVHIAAGFSIVSAMPIPVQRLGFRSTLGCGSGWFRRTRTAILAKHLE